MRLRHAVLTLALAGLAAHGAHAQGVTLELYGGFVPERSERFGAGFDRIESGQALGFGLYETDLLPRIELGLDVMSTAADNRTIDVGRESLSLMLNARLPFSLGNGVTAYIGAGLGAVRITFDGRTLFPGVSGDETVAGAQTEAGLRYAFTPRATMFLGLRHQSALGEVTIEGFEQTYSSNSALVGIRFGF